jgi:hypothetical protein
VGIPCELDAGHAAAIEDSNRSGRVHTQHRLYHNDIPRDVTLINCGCARPWSRSRTALRSSGRGHPIP